MDSASSRCQDLFGIIRRPSIHEEPVAGRCAWVCRVEGLFNVGEAQALWEN